MESMRTLIRTKHGKFTIRWFQNSMRYWFLDRHHLIIELGKFSLVWIRH